MDTIEQIVEHAAEVLQTGIRQDCNLPEFDGMAEFRRVITTALQAQSEKGRQWNQLLELQLTNLQSLYTELNAAVVGYLEMRVSYEELLPHLTLKGEEESPAETGKTRNAALTAHDEALPFKPCPRCGADGDTHCGCYAEDEALPGEWRVGEDQPVSYPHRRIFCGPHHIGNATNQAYADAIAAAHNSALREIYGLHRESVRRIVESRRWRHLPNPEVQPLVDALDDAIMGRTGYRQRGLKALQPYSGQKDGK